MSKQRVAVITGANRGLGLETARRLARAGCRVVLTGRSLEKTESAAEQLRSEGLKDVHFQHVDVTSDEEVAILAGWLERHWGGADILVNNAGMVPDRYSASGVLQADLEAVVKGFEINAVGSLRMVKALVPAMQARRWGRVVNVSTGMAGLAEMNGGFPGYRMSKVALNAVTRMLADELQGSGVLVNSVCPGWVRTDMGGPTAPRDVAEGAASIVWAALLPDDGPHGGFFRDGQPLAW